MLTPICRVAMCHMNGKLDTLATTFSLVRETEPGNTACEDTSLQTDPLHPHFIETVKSKDNTGLVGRTKETPPTRLSGFRMRTTVSWTRIDTGIAVLSLQSSSGALVYSEASRKGDDTSKPEKKSFVISILWRFSSCRRGFRISIKDSLDSWSFSAACKRPCDSQIFTHCGKGNTREVHKLLLSGEASVSDMDTYGRGPLHVSEVACTIAFCSNTWCLSMLVEMAALT
jgi:hypothetical protein